LSAKWRRTKRHSERFDVFKALNKAKDKNTAKFRTKTSKIKRQSHPYKYRTSRIYGERRLREPEPLIDVFEEKNEIIVITEFAGFKRENLRIRLKDQRLTLSAETLNRKYHKSLNLPKRVIPSKICTAYKNGVLEIRLKKAIEERAIDKVAG